MDEAPLHGSCDFNHDPFEDTQFACVGHHRDQRISPPPPVMRRTVLIFFLKSPLPPSSRFILEFSLFERISSSSFSKKKRKCLVKESSDFTE